MKAYKGVVKGGVVELEAGVDLPDGCLVTVTVTDGEIVLATIRNLFAGPLLARRAFYQAGSPATWAES